MKKRTGKMISLSLAVAMAVTAAPVTALADENTQSSVIEASELTPAQSAGETGTDTTTVDTKEEEGTAWAELTPAEKVEEEAVNALPAEEVVEEVEEVADAPTYEENEIISIKSSEDLVNAIKNQKNGQTWELAAGEYDVYNAEGTLTGTYDSQINGETGFAFPITANNLKIKAADGAEGKVTITSSYRPDAVQGGVWHNQNFITVASEGVTIEGVNLQGNPNDYNDGQCNKVIELVDNAKNFKLSNVNLLPIKDSNGKVSSGSIYINVADPGETVIENVTLYSWINARAVTTNTVEVNNVTIDFTQNTYSGYQQDPYGYAWNPAISGNNVTVKDLTVCVDNTINLKEQVFNNSLRENTTVELVGENTTFDVDGELPITVDNVTLNGNGNTLNLTEDSDIFLHVNGADHTTIQDVTINTGEHAKHAVQFYKALDAELIDATITNEKQGYATCVMVNASKVLVKDCELSNAFYPCIEYAMGNNISDSNYIPNLTVENVVGNENLFGSLIRTDKDTFENLKKFDEFKNLSNEEIADKINEDYLTGAEMDSNGFAEIAYDITFDANGGTLSGEGTMTTDANGKLTSALPTASLSGYRFDGWYTATSGGEKITADTVFTEDTTVYAQWSKKSSGGSHRYDGYITIINPKNGEVSVSDDWADEDEKITLTITPDKGYVVDKIEIVDAEGDKIDAKKVEDKDDKYTFRMANCDVTVTVTFKEEGKTTEDTDKEEDKDDETTETTKLNFTDVKESDWFFKGVEYVVDKGIMSGVSENEFAPSGKLTRAMLVQMLYNMESRPACDAENAFIDVPVGQWYTDAVIWANDAKIVSGMGEGLFAPNMEITREQMVAMLYNYAKYKGYDVTASADLSTFADNASVSAWAKPAMQWAVAEGYISGMGDNQLAPQGTATRAEIASVIMRFMEATAETAE